MKRIVFVLAMLLNACAASHPTRIVGTGEQVSPPVGWVDYCHRHPDDVDCVTWMKGPAQ